MKTIDITCANCGKIVVKQLKEYKRQIKSGQTRFYCNNTCSVIVHNLENPPKGNPKYLIADNRKDIYTPFRYFVSKSKDRDKKKKRGVNITVEYLKQLWEEQNGICSFTGWNLLLPNSTGKAWEISSPKNASLDRIDNSKGYIQGNVRFIAYIANLARQSFADEQLIEFCKAVSNVK